MSFNCSAEWVRSLVPSIVGGLITGFFALYGVYRAYQYNLKKQKKDEKNLIRGVLQALRDEINTLWDIYILTAGQELENLQQNAPFTSYYPITQDYFTIYTGNASLIGRIKNDDLRKAIVTTYTKARGLVDSFRLNNDFISKFEYWHSLSQQDYHPVYARNAEIYHTSLITYAGKLQNSHNHLKALVQNLLQLFSNEIALSMQDE
jgi:hypothetical protein